MRILHVITSIDRGGAETQLLILCKEHLSMGHDLRVYSIRGPGALSKEFEVCNIKMLYPKKHNSWVMECMALRNYIMNNSIDVIHAHLPRAEMLVRLFLIGLKTTFVISRHNFESFIPNRSYFITRLSSPLSRWVTRRANRVIAISNSVKELMEVKREVSDPKKLSTVYYGFDTGIHYSQEQDVLSSSNALTIGTVARLVPQKNIDTLLQSFALTASQLENAHLTIVGSGPDENKLKRLTRSLGLEEKVQWIPNTKERLEIMKRFNVFVLPSEYEGFGLVLLEAMQLGVPIIGSKNTAIVEVLGTDYCGLFPTRDYWALHKKTLEFFSHSQSKYLELLTYYQHRLRQFSPRAMAAEILSHYQK